MVTAKQGMKIKKFKQEWVSLDEELRGLLIPHLLISLPAWRAWSLNDNTKLQWLERQFNEVGLSFTSNDPCQAAGRDAGHGRIKRQHKVAHRSV
jgi:hypothetical protein